MLQLDLLVVGVLAHSLSVCKMSSLRHRGVSLNSPPVESVQRLSAALRQAKEVASDNGLSQENLASFLAKTRLKLPPTSSANQKSTKKKPCLSKCLKIVWNIWVVCTILVGLFVLYILYGPKAKIISDHQFYTITRLLRLGLATLAPYIKSGIGHDIVNSNCYVSNPLVNESMSCPCMYIKESVELQLNETHKTMPQDILSIPNNKVYVLRDAVKGLTNFSLDVFEQYEGRMFPNMCFEMSSGESGIQVITDLFDKKKVDQYLDHPKQPWTFSWQECPSEENPLTFRSLLPSWEWLPPNVTVSNLSYFTLSSQWASATQDWSAFKEEDNFIAMLVLFGDVRIFVEPWNKNCYFNCISFTKKPVLRAGDIIVFDQTYWEYTTLTWTKAALTCAVAITAN